MILAFTGPMGCGKTTACDFLLSQHPFTKLSFKTPLIEELKRNFPQLLQDLSAHYGMSVNDLFLKKPPMVRHLMQEYGTDVRRKDDKDYWVKEWKRAAVGDILVDDVRFLNEAAAVRELGGKIIRLTRPDLNASGGHVSETEMADILPDYTIETSLGDLDTLRDALQALIRGATPKPEERVEDDE